jgi:hypothetical protein
MRTPDTDAEPDTEPGPRHLVRIVASERFYPAERPVHVVVGCIGVLLHRCVLYIRRVES